MCWNYRQWRYVRRRQSMDEQADFSGDLPVINIDGMGIQMSEAESREVTRKTAEMSIHI